MNPDLTLAAADNCPNNGVHLWFSREARIYRNVLSPSPWTIPSHASIFTGLPVSAHGATWAHPSLDERFETLAEQLKRVGYQTLGLSTNPMVSAHRNFAQGFDYFDNPEWLGARADRFKSIAERFLAVLGGGRKVADSHSNAMHRALGNWFRSEFDKDRPFFVFLNYNEAHAPYQSADRNLIWASEATWRKWTTVNQYRFIGPYQLGAESLSEEEIKELRDLYDEEIAYVDRKLGELFQFLRRTGLEKNTVIVVTSDHGEHFGEHHLMEHQYSLYEPLVRVPLIVRYPPLFPAGEDSNLVQSHDIYPTLLQVAEVEWEATAGHTSRSLVGAVESEGRIAVSEYLWPSTAGLASFTARYPTLDISSLLSSKRVVQQGSAKLLLRRDAPPQLYDLASDPEELLDRSADRRAETVNLQEQLEDWLSSFEPYREAAEAQLPEAEVSSEDLDRLRALGYVE